MTQGEELLIHSNSFVRILECDIASGAQVKCYSFPQSFEGNRHKGRARVENSTYQTT